MSTNPDDNCPVCDGTGQIDVDDPRLPAIQAILDGELGTTNLNEHDFTEVLTRAVELADGEKGWTSAVVGRPDDPLFRAPTKALRREVTTYEGSRYRVTIIALPEGAGEDEEG